MLTVYGIETGRFDVIESFMADTVAIVLTVYGIETIIINTDNRII